MLKVGGGVHNDQAPFLCVTPHHYLLTQALNYIHGFELQYLLKPHDKYSYCHPTRVYTIAAINQYSHDQPEIRWMYKTIQFLLKLGLYNYRKVGLISQILHDTDILGLLRCYHYQILQSEVVWCCKHLLAIGY